MGAESYSNWVPGVLEPAKALSCARLGTFQQHRFRGSELNPPTQEAALALAGEAGTGSIIDIQEISDTEKPGAANGLDEEELVMYFQTPFPSRAMIETCDELAAEIGRGCARFVAAYEAGSQVGWVFLGVSYD